MNKNHIETNAYLVNTNYDKNYKSKSVNPLEREFHKKAMHFINNSPLRN